MLKKQQNSPAPCFIGEGTLVNKRDMMRVLETLENVKYQYRVDNRTITRGEGVVVRVFAGTDGATLVANGCLFLNVLSFDYLHFHQTSRGRTVVELNSDSRVLKLVPLDEDGRPSEATLHDHGLEWALEADPGTDRRV